MGNHTLNDLKRKELAHLLCVDPNQRFLLRRKECEILVDVIIGLLKQALLDGRGIDLFGFGRIFMFEMGPRKLFNYKLRKAIEVKKCYMAKVKLKPQFKRAVKHSQRERDNA